MNKKTTYVVVGVVAVAVIAGLAFYMNQGSAPGGNSPMGASPMSMKDILAKGQSQKCTYSSNIGGVESSGVVYTASGRMRTDFIAKVDGGEMMESHMIIDGETAYVWGNQMEQGIKMNVGAMGAEAGAQANGGVDLNEKMNYNCGNWPADQGQFSQPSNITFVDLSAAIPGISY